MASNSDHPYRTGLPDGLYAVVQSRWVAGFIVEAGRVHREDCAPVLWRRLPYWVTVARRVQDGGGTNR